MKSFVSNKITKSELIYFSQFLALLILAAFLHPFLEKLAPGFGTDILIFSAFWYFAISLFKRKLVFPSMPLWRYKYKGLRAVLLSLGILLMLMLSVFINNSNIINNYSLLIFSIPISLMYSAILHSIALKTSENYE